MKRLIRLYGPLCLAAFLLFVSVSPSQWIPRGADGSYFTLSLKDVPYVPVALQGITLKVVTDLQMRSMFWLAAIALTASYAFLDFSRIIPGEHDMLLYFDDAGITRTIKELLPLDGHDFRVLESFADAKRNYMAQLTKDVDKAINLPDGYILKPDFIATKGQTTFKMRKLAGMRRYKFEEADGHLVHCLTDISMEFMTLFKKVSTPYDVFEVPFIKAVRNNHVTTIARFRQHVHSNPQQRLTEVPDDVLGVTRIRLFPFPTLEKSLYLSIAQDGSAIPVAYSVYCERGKG